MPDIFDLTDKYREQLIRREDQARRSMLRDYRGVWRGLEDKIDSTLGGLADSEGALAELGEQFRAEFADLKPGQEAEIPLDKIGKLADLLLKKDPWKKLENKIDADFETVADAAAATTGTHGNELGNTAVGHALTLVGTALLKEQERNLARGAEIPEEELEEMIERVKEAIARAWKANSLTLQKSFRDKAAEVAQKARAALRREALLSLLTGARGAQILGRVKQAIEDREKNPEADPALVRALRSEYRIAVQEGYRETLRFTFSESGRVASWRWTSARTPETCALCWAMDGKIFPIDTPLRSHPHCRCVPVPLVENERGETESETERKGGETGNAAFAGIPADQQRAILGLKAFEAYQQGEFDLSDLVGVQFDTRFGVAIYRRSVDDAVKISGANESGPAEDIEISSGSAGRESVPRTAGLVSGSTGIFDDGSFSFSRANFIETGEPIFRNASFSGDDKKPKPAGPRLYRNRSFILTRLAGETQAAFERRALRQHGSAAGLRGEDLENFVTQWANANDSPDYQLQVTRSDGLRELLSNATFKSWKKIPYKLSKQILEDLWVRQIEAYKKAQLGKVKAAPKQAEPATGGSGGGGKDKKKKGDGTDTDSKPADPTAPKLPGQQDADDIIASLPGFGIGDGTFTIAVANSGGPPLSDFFILGDFIQLKFGGVMWGDKVNEYATMAIQAGVKIQVLERNDESNPRIYKVRFSPADLQKLARLKLEWEQEYLHTQLALEKSREEVNNMFLDLLKIYPNLGVEFLEQIANIPVDVLNELGDPVGLIPLLGPAYKNSKMWFALLGYESPDFRLFEVPRISFDSFKFQYKSEKFKREGEAIEQGTLFIINLILLKRSLMKLPKGPPENPLGLRPTPKPTSGAPVVPKAGEPVVPKPEPVLKPLNETAAIPKVKTPVTTKTATKTPGKTPKPTTPKPTTPKQKTVETPPQPKPVSKKPRKVTTSEKPVTPQKDGGYKGKWPPEPPVGKKPGVNTAEGADWRYQRYVQDAFKKGKKPEEVLSRKAWESSKLEPTRAGNRPGRSGGPKQQATRQEMVREEGFTNTETTQLGTRIERTTKKVKKNMVDLVKRNNKGGMDYVEVDPMSKGGLPSGAMRYKLKMELRNLKPNDTLTFVDSANRMRRIEYKYGEPPSVIDTRRFTPNQ